MANLKSARGQFTIVDLNDGRSVSMFLSISSNGAYQLLHNIDTNTYTPSYNQSTPLVITPVLTIGGEGDRNIATTATDSTIENISWTINGIEITSTSLDDNPNEFGAYLRDIDENKTKRELVITSNMVKTSYNITCKIDYLDRTGALQISASTSFLRVETTELSFYAFITLAADNVDYFDKEHQTITLQLDAYLGNAKVTNDISYIWEYFDSTTNTYKPLNTVVKTQVGIGATDRENPYWYKGKLIDESLSDLYALGATLNTANQITISADAIDSVLTIRGIATLHPEDSTSMKTDDDYYTLRDLSDPYLIIITSDQGDKLTTLATYTVLTATLWQGGELILNSLNYTFDWDMFDSNGQPVAEYNSSGDPITIEDGTGYWKVKSSDKLQSNGVDILPCPGESTKVLVKTGGKGRDTIIVTKDMINNRATFVCTVKF